MVIFGVQPNNYLSWLCWRKDRSRKSVLFLKENFDFQYKTRTWVANVCQLFYLYGILAQKKQKLQNTPNNLGVKAVFVQKYQNPVFSKLSARKRNFDCKKQTPGFVFPILRFDLSNTFTLSSPDYEIPRHLWHFANNSCQHVCPTPRPRAGRPFNPA